MATRNLLLPAALCFMFLITPENCNRGTTEEFCRNSATARTEPKKIKSSDVADYETFGSFVRFKLTTKQSWGDSICGMESYQWVKRFIKEIDEHKKSKEKELDNQKKEKQRDDQPSTSPRNSMTTTPVALPPTTDKSTTLPTNRIQHLATPTPAIQTTTTETTPPIAPADTKTLTPTYATASPNEESSLNKNVGSNDKNADLGSKNQGSDDSGKKTMMTAILSLLGISLFLVSVVTYLLLRKKAGRAAQLELDSKSNVSTEDEKSEMIPAV